MFTPPHIFSDAIDPSGRKGPALQYVDHWSRNRTDATAVRTSEDSLSWAELRLAIDATAQWLSEQGVGLGAVVAVSLPRSIDWFVLLLSIWDRGAVYLPLDPLSPPERQQFIRETATPDFVITADQTTPATNSLPMPYHVERLGDGRTASRTPESLWLDAAYVIFTSGSTGRPKGVVNTHAGLGFALTAMAELLPIGTDDVVLQNLAASFDASLFEVGMALANGAALAITPQGQLPGPELDAFIRSTGVTALATTPSILRAVTNSEVPALRTVITGGEVLDADLAARWLPARRLFNVYGPTEVALWSSIAEVLDASAIDVGRPLPGLMFHLLGTDGPENTALTPGVRGELVISGPSVANGYLGGAATAHAAFDPIDGPTTARCYRTGDQMAFSESGTYAFLGRVDRQVKVRGFRIELGEVEAQLSATPGVAECRVRVVGQYGGARLSAVLTPTATGTPQVHDAKLLQDVAALAEGHYRSTGHTDTGWVDGTSRLPLGLDVMDEWLSTSRDRILAHRPRAVVEVGCGEGRLAAELLPHISDYIGIDVSQTALERFRSTLDPSDGSVDLRCADATLLTKLEPGTADAVVLNSVVQYFPSLNYLTDVIVAAARLLTPGGVIYVGDIRDLRLWDHFTRTRIRARNGEPPTHGDVDALLRSERELLMDPEFFWGLPNLIDQISSVAVLLRPSSTDDEMSRFRIDALLYTDSRVRQSLEEDRIDSHSGTHAAVNDRLEVHHGLLNARLDNGATAAQVPESGIVQHDPHHECEARNGRFGLPLASRTSPGLFDLVLVPEVMRDQTSDVFRAISTETPPSWPSSSGEPSPLSNDPGMWLTDQELVARARARAESALPIHMRPTDYVVCSRLPLSIHGKVQNDQLPRPPVETPSNFSPEGGVEELVAHAWRSALGRPPTDADETFFEAGGTSLQLVELIDQLHVQGKDIPVSVAMRHPSVAAITAMLNGAGDAGPSLIPLNAAGDLLVRTGHSASRDQEVLVFVHALAGTVSCYGDVVEAVDQPAFGLLAGAQPGADIYRQAEEYADLISTSELSGRINLVGWSFGGILAYEVGSVLLHRGHQTRVSLVDAAVPLVTDSDRQGRWDRLSAHTSRGQSVWTGGMNAARARAVIDSLTGYRPTNSMGVVDLLVAGERPAGEVDDPLFTQGDALGWDEYSDVQLTTGPGGHLTILEEDPLMVADWLKKAPR